MTALLHSMLPTAMVAFVVSPTAVREAQRPAARASLQLSAESPATMIIKKSQSAWYSKGMDTLASDKNMVVSPTAAPAPASTTAAAPHGGQPKWMQACGAYVTSPEPRTVPEAIEPATPAPPTTSAISPAAIIIKRSQKAWHSKGMDAFASDKTMVISPSAVPTLAPTTTAAPHGGLAWMQGCGAYGATLAAPAPTNDAVPLTSNEKLPDATSEPAAPPASEPAAPAPAATGAMTPAAMLRKQSQKAWQAKHELNTDMLASDKGVVVPVGAAPKKPAAQKRGQPKWMVACGAYGSS